MCWTVAGRNVPSVQLAVGGDLAGMSWRKKVNPGKEKKKRDARKKEFALVLARIRDNDPGLKAASLRQLGLVEADAEELYDALKGNTVLRSLDISRNHLRDGGAV